MIEEKSIGLKANEALSKTLEKLWEKFQHLNFHYPEFPPSPTVAEDFPSRYGCMIYQDAAVCAINGKEWILAQGKNDGYYLTERYRVDLLALNLPTHGNSKDIYSIVKDEIESSTFFKNSILLALNDGNLAVMPCTRFEKRAKESIAPRVSDFIVQTPEYDSRYILASTLRHPTTKIMLYKEEIVDFLANAVEDILNDPPQKRRVYF